MALPPFISGGEKVTSDVIIGLYVQMMELAIPFVFIMWVCDFLTCSILRAAFGGRLTFGGWK